jgi:MscS family membrane protein
MNLLRDFLGDTVLAVLLSGLLYVVAAWLVGRLLSLVLRIMRQRLAGRTRTNLDDYLLEVLQQFITPLLMLIVFYFTSKAILPYFARRAMLEQRLADGVNAALYVITALFVAFVISRLIDALVRWYLKDVAARTNTRLDDELAPLINRVLKILVYVLGVIVILNHFNQDISTLVVSFGVGSLAIALAAQETLANMIAGFILMIDRPFRVHDRIRLPDGTIGNVSEIGIRSTKVIDDNHVMIITPNAEIVKSQIKNFSYPNDIVRFQVPFGVAYGTDIAHMQRIIIDRLNQEDDIIEPETTEVRVVNLGDSSVQCEAFCKLQNPNVIPRRRSQIMLVIYETLRIHGFEIPFPQRVVHIAHAPQEASHAQLAEQPPSHGA